MKHINMMHSTKITNKFQRITAKYLFGIQFDWFQMGWNVYEGISVFEKMIELKNGQTIRMIIWKTPAIKIDTVHWCLSNRRFRIYFFWKTHTNYLIHWSKSIPFHFRKWPHRDLWLKRVSSFRQKKEEERWGGAKCVCHWYVLAYGNEKLKTKYQIFIDFMLVWALFPRVCISVYII